MATMALEHGVVLILDPDEKVSHREMEKAGVVIVTNGYNVWIKKVRGVVHNDAIAEVLHPSAPIGD